MEDTFVLLFPRALVITGHMSPHSNAGRDSDEHVAWLDRYYGAQRHIYDLTRPLFLFGRGRMLRQLGQARPASVLEVGCGTARNLAWLARRMPGAFLCGVDASREMLRSARRHAGLHLHEACAEAIAGPDQLGRPGGFDAVFLSYALSMIPDWRGALEAARRCVAPGGSLHIVDFWDFAGWPRCLRGFMRQRLKSHRVRHEPGVLQWLRKADAEITPVRGRWAFIARLVAGP